MKFALLIAAVSAVQLETMPITRDATVDAAVQNHHHQAIAHAHADDQAEHVRHHYGAFTPSGTNYQTWGNESTGGFTGANRVSGIENTTSMAPHGQQDVITAHNIRNGWTGTVNGDNVRTGKF